MSILDERAMTLLIGRPADLTDDTDPVNIAEKYVMSRQMAPGQSSTLRKAQRAIRIAGGLRGLPPPRRALPLRPIGVAAKAPYQAKRPHIVRELTLVEVTDETTGKVVKRFPYLHTIDRSRYGPERLRDIRRNRKYR